MFTVNVLTPLFPDQKDVLLRSTCLTSEKSWSLINAVSNRIGALDNVFTPDISTFAKLGSLNVDINPWNLIYFNPSS